MMFFFLRILSYDVNLYPQGSYVYDINGNKYLDSLAGLWCTALGMCKYDRWNVIFMIIYYRILHFQIKCALQIIFVALGVMFKV